MPKSQITILLPVHADAPFLESCLHSLNNLIIPEKTNLIIILDRVSDLTREKIDRIELAMPLRIIINSQFGLVNSLNLGLSAAESEFIARIDHDDMMQFDRLEKQLSFFRKNPDHILVGSNVTLIDQNETRIRETNYPINNDEIVRILSHKNAFAHPSVMYRRTAAITSGMYRKFYEGAEDYDLWLRMTGIGKVANLQDSLTLYRQHSGQMSIKNLREQWIITEAVKTSARLTKRQKNSLNVKYPSVEDWYQNNKSIRFKHRVVMAKSFLKNAKVQK
jgi:glycosyltransferase involved in cell wall biosynthesis